MKTLHLLLLFFALVACKPKTHDQEPRVVLKDSLEQKDSMPNKPDDNHKIELKDNQILGKFESCTVFAGASDYFFLTEDGKRLKITVTTLMDEPSVKVPDNLVVEDKANPAQVGKQFIISFDAKKQPTEIAPVE